MKNPILITIVVAMVVVGGAFYGGMKYQESKQPAFVRQLNGQGMRQVNGGQAGQGAGNRPGFRPVTGEIISLDDIGITVKLQDGSSKIVVIPDSTQINKAGEATKSDLMAGEQVSVFGTTNADGSITAQTIQLGDRK